MKVKHSYLLLLIICVLSLFFASFVEYIMHLPPCPLCIYQRYPYFVFIFIAIIALSRNCYKPYNKYIITTMLAAIILAGYHTGIERGFFELSSICNKPAAPITENTTVADFKNYLYNQEIAICNKPALVVFGFSMTEWNLLLNVLLLFIFLWVIWLKPALDRQEE